MRTRLVIVSALFGILASFAAWAVTWKLADYADVTFALKGETTALELAASPELTARATADHSPNELRAFLAREGLTLVTASVGDGPPGLQAEDPGSRLGWLPEQDGDNAATYLFAGTYSADLWLRGGQVPFVADDAAIAGVIDPPGGIGSLQFVVDSIGPNPPPGDYVISTADPDLLREAVLLLQESGLELRESRAMPLVRDLLEDPLVNATSLLLVLAAIATGMHWVLTFAQLRREYTIRMRHGARRLGLVTSSWARGIVWQCIGVALGSVVTLGIVVSIGREPITENDLLAVGLGAAGGLLLSAVLRFGAGAIAIRGRED
ncbi:hypothetical protein [Cellulosimicrobium marinum]|uniref:hypothetical protein n=1 Tax=Cellulosimicrobium marinum TaxID=1638992 RepID=UPI001E60169F|nr:hypothetical protein [Cellulosimicrobium marinum]MCB7138257.1 hypothetical protein [Cellulosimicrobium marinum]